MTIHRSKGLEFAAVFLIGLDEGILPSWQAIRDSESSMENAESMEEERRLCYVAMTRARDYLFLSSCRTRYFSARTRRFCESGFISEIRTPSLVRVPQVADNPSGFAETPLKEIHDDRL